MMEAVTDMEEGQALRRARHGRGPGMDEGPRMMVVVTDMVEGQARERRQASFAWKAMDRFLHEWARSLSNKF